MAKEVRNVAASVRDRLLQLAKASGQSFDLVLTRFALERLLFRLSQSPHAGRFVLKGAMLMMSWFDDPHRGTRDLDLLGFGDPEPDLMLKTFRDILAQQADDGVTFDAEALRVDRIRGDWNMVVSGCGWSLRSAAPASTLWWTSVLAMRLSPRRRC
jgi:predicted nucleotidyltransferase component of viral defense system